MSSKMNEERKTGSSGKDWDRVARKYHYLNITNKRDSAILQRRMILQNNLACEDGVVVGIRHTLQNIVSSKRPSQVYGLDHIQL